MKNGLVALIVGLIFGLGLSVSGMTQPQKVISFLDVFGAWDPSLAFVMLSAIGVHALAYRFQKRRPSPLLADKYHLPDRKDIDKRLISGAAIFGLGWGLAGLCPGPALVSLVGLERDSLLFVVAMTLGMVVHDNGFSQLKSFKKLK